MELFGHREDPFLKCSVWYFIILNQKRGVVKYVFEHNGIRIELYFVRNGGRYAGEAENDGL